MEGPCVIVLEFLFFFLVFIVCWFFSFLVPLFFVFCFSSVECDFFFKWGGGSYVLSQLLFFTFF